MDTLLQNLYLLEYPELLAAGVLGLALLLWVSRAGATVLCDRLSIPAVLILNLVPERYFHWLTRQLVWSGWRGRSSFSRLASSKIYMPIILVLLGLVAPLPLVLLVAALSFFLPDLVVLLIVRRRRSEIRDALPQALDLMVLCVDAGLGLDATLQRIFNERSILCNALNSELCALANDILLGMDRERAYVDLYNRTGVDELRSLGCALNQSSKFGIPLGRILREQSDYLRDKLSRKAEEKAAKLPIYMAFPLWFCIMPALLVIVLAPSFIIFFQQVKPLMFR